MSNSEQRESWQDGRCAIFGEPGHLVTDHDHTTALVRGLLCCACNTHEGLYPGDDNAWGRYRSRPPAVLLGVQIRYWHPRLRRFAEPIPEPTMAERWRDHPLRDIGL